LLQPLPTHKTVNAAASCIGLAFKPTFSSVEGLRLSTLFPAA
jgi:hypothetical protein